MNARYPHLGATTALVALAVVVSLGSVTDVQAGAALAHLHPQARAQVAGESQAVADFLARLNQAVRLLQGESHPSCSAAVVPNRVNFHLLPLMAAERIALDDARFAPMPPLAFALIDMPPPSMLR